MYCFMSFRSFKFKIILNNNCLYAFIGTQLVLSNNIHNKKIILMNRTKIVGKSIFESGYLISIVKFSLGQFVEIEPPPHNRNRLQGFTSSFWTKRAPYIRRNTIGIKLFRSFRGFIPCRPSNCSRFIHASCSGHNNIIFVPVQTLTAWRFLDNIIQQRNRSRHSHVLYIILCVQICFRNCFDLCVLFFLLSFTVISLEILSL